MPAYDSKQPNSEFAALMEGESSNADKDFTIPYEDALGHDYFVTGNTDIDGELFDAMGYRHVALPGCVAGVSKQNCVIESQPKPSLLPLTISPPSNPVMSQATPTYPHPDSTPLNDLDRNPLAAHLWAFSHYHIKSQGGILNWYGSGYRLPQDNAEESVQHDQSLLAEYIRSDSKLTAQLAFVKNQRTKRQTDSNLAQDYRFIVSLYTALKIMEFEEAPRRRLSSKAILACLDVKASWLSRASQVVKLLDKFGPDGTSPDPLVVRRLQSGRAIRKGSDLLTFLKQRDCAQRNALPH